MGMPWRQPNAAHAGAAVEPELDVGVISKEGSRVCRNHLPFASVSCHDVLCPAWNLVCCGGDLQTTFTLFDFLYSSANCSKPHGKNKLV